MLETIDGDYSNASATATMRQLTQRQNREKNAYAQKQRHLQMENQAICDDIEKVKKDMMQTFLRLEEERTFLQRHGTTNDSQVFRDTSDIEEDDEDFVRELEEDVVNPYPIIPGALSLCRRSSLELPLKQDDRNDCEEPEGRPSSGRVLPPLAGGSSMTNLSNSPGSLDRSGSVNALRSSMESVWIGDPEAISSIRRPCKPQALRGFSGPGFPRRPPELLKDITPLGVGRLKTVARSHSLKESEHKERQFMLRSRSLKERPKHDDVTASAETPLCRRGAMRIQSVNVASSKTTEGAINQQVVKPAGGTTKSTGGSSKSLLQRRHKERKTT